MTTERDTVIQKVQRLLALGNSNYEAEANTAMTKAGKLMEEWGLSISDVELADEKIIYRKIDTGGRNAPVTNGLLVILGKFTNCKLWVTTPFRRKYYKTIDKSNYMINIIGYEQDVELFEHFYKMLERTVVAEYNRFKKTDKFKEAQKWEHGKRIRHSFIEGFTYRVRDTLYNLTEEQNSYKTSNGTALVPLKMAAVDNYFEEEFGIKLTHRSVYRRGASSHAGFDGGSAAGKKVRFNDAVNGLGAGTKLIG